MAYPLFYDAPSSFLFVSTIFVLWINIYFFVDSEIERDKNAELYSRNLNLNYSEIWQVAKDILCELLA